MPRPPAEIKEPEFDGARIGHCPGCGAKVRMFSGGQWWIDPKNPPSGTDWWCADCLQHKTTVAVMDLG